MVDEWIQYPTLLSANAFHIQSPGSSCRLNRFDLHACHRSAIAQTFRSPSWSRVRRAILGRVAVQLWMQFIGSLKYERFLPAVEPCARDSSFTVWWCVNVPRLRQPEPAEEREAASGHQERGGLQVCS